MRRVLAEHKLDVRGRRVVLKPNLVEFEPESTINTHPLLVHATLEAFRALGAPVCDRGRARAIAAARSTWPTPPATSRPFPDFEDLFTDLNLDEVSRVRLARPVSRLNSLYLPHTVLGSDLLVSMPKMKTHHWAGATLSMKNLFGMVPGGVYGWPKNVLHWAGIHECIADLHSLFPQSFRDRGRHRGDGRERADSRAAQGGGRDRVGARPGGGGRHLLPDHADRAVARRVSDAGRGLGRNRGEKYPANRRNARFRSDAVRIDNGVA